MTTNPRKHGEAPFDVAVVHGGPGAAGEVAPLACHLARDHGVLEPFQTERTLDGQVDELGALLGGNASGPIALVGYSWGAMLGLIFAARNPSRVRKLVLVSSAVFDDKYAADISATRIGRMSADQRLAFESLARRLADPASSDRDALFAELGELISAVDSFDPVPCAEDVIYDYDIFESVWPQAEALRESGELLALARGVDCPVVAIHGDYDPHPSAGIEGPLAAAIDDFRFVMLEDCGHKPWVERSARQAFFDILDTEVG